MEIKGSFMPVAITGATEKAESVCSNTDHCKRRKLSSNSNTEASSSCNLEPKKHPKKVLRKMAVPPLELDLSGWKKEYHIELSATLNSCHTKFVLEVAATAISRPKTRGAPFFTSVECVFIGERLTEEHGITLFPDKIEEILNYSCHGFREYCKVMKQGKDGLSFCRETGHVYEKKFVEQNDPLKVKLGFIQHQFFHVIENFDILKRIYQCIWDEYFKSGSSKRSRSTGISGSSKKSKFSIFTMSSVNNFEWANDIIEKIRKLFLMEGDRPLPSGVLKTISKYYSDAKACEDFLRHDDVTAIIEFRSKAKLLESSSDQHEGW